MAKHTTRDQIWHAALEYAEEWDELARSERKNEWGFTAPELIDERDLEASQKTVTDCLLTMAEMSRLEAVGSGKDGPTPFQLAP